MLVLALPTRNDGLFLRHPRSGVAAQENSHLQMLMALSLSFKTGTPDMIERQRAIR